MTRIIRAALAAVALMTVVASPVFAGKPIVRTIEDSGSQTIRCETVTLVEEYTRSVVVTTWLDDDGNRTRAHARVRVDGTITAPGSTLELSDVGRFTSFVDFEPGGPPTVRDVGMVYKFSAPGLGVVAHEVGVITYFPDGSVETKGPHDVWNNGLEALLCPLFE